MFNGVKNVVSKATAILLSALLFAFGIVAIPHIASAATAEVEGGNLEWGISGYLGAGSFGRPGPLADAYEAPATFDSETKISTWGDPVLDIAGDGYEISFQGTAVLFAMTSGTWMRITDPQLRLDTDGNGVMSALIGYGTAPGTFPEIVYDPAQAPEQDAARINILDIAGNDDALTESDSLLNWQDLESTWSDEFLAYIAGDEENDIPGFTYASNITNDAEAEKLPSLLNVAIELTASTPAPSENIYDSGEYSWGLSGYLASASMGRPNPLPEAFTGGAKFDTEALIASWELVSATVSESGDAELAFAGTSVNFAKTGGGWLKITDPQLELDAQGNGVMSAEIAYGLAPGSFPNIVFDPAQEPLRGPERINVLQFVGNNSGPELGVNTASWSELTSEWDQEFLDFLAGDEDADIAAFAYASVINNVDADRIPAPVNIEIGQTPEAVATTTSLSIEPTNSVTTGTKVRLKATVSPQVAGSVVFKQGSKELGTVNVASGVAILNTTAPASAGSYAYSAEFIPSDSAAFQGSNSAPVSLTVTAKVAAKPGVLSWGFKASFRSYILSGGSISTSGGAGGSTSLFQFPQAGNSFDHASGTGSANYSGTVTFQYPNHGIDIKLSNPRIVIESANSASLIVNLTAGGVTSTNVTFAQLALNAGTKTTDKSGVTTFANVPASLTAAGSEAFMGFYGAGESLDPLSFTIGEQGKSFSAVSASGEEEEWTAPATPPATTGLEIDGVNPDGSVQVGSEVSLSASGFVPNETGIRVVVYSDPIVVAENLNADATGNVVWSGVLPTELIGEHTITFQGSKNVGIVVNIVDPMMSINVATDAYKCALDSAELRWGFKETWRSYLTTIAQGGWDTSNGAEYETPEFILHSTGGSIDPESGAAIIAFAGEINFYGHDGALNTTLGNITLEITDSGEAYIVADIVGELREGGEVKQEQVCIAEITHAEIAASGETTTYEAVFTTEGGEAFSYAAGDAMDPISLTVNYGDCGLVNGGAADADDSGSSLVWLWGLLGIITVLVVLAVVVFVVRKNAKK